MWGPEMQDVRIAKISKDKILAQNSSLLRGKEAELNDRYEPSTCF
jgi:hypothetical protein